MVEHEAVALEGREVVELVEHRVVDVGQREQIATRPQEPVPVLADERVADREQREAAGDRRVGSPRDLEERLVDQLVGVLRVQDRREPAEVLEVLGVELDEVEPIPSKGSCSSARRPPPDPSPEVASSTSNADATACSSGGAPSSGTSRTKSTSESPSDMRRESRQGQVRTQSAPRDGMFTR